MRCCLANMTYRVGSGRHRRPGRGRPLCSGQPRNRESVQACPRSPKGSARGLRSSGRAIRRALSVSCGGIGECYWGESPLPGLARTSANRRREWRRRRIRKEAKVKSQPDPTGGGGGRGSLLRPRGGGQPDHHLQVQAAGPGSRDTHPETGVSSCRYRACGNGSHPSDVTTT